MAAYVISEVEMLDETQGRRYRELAAGSIARHGGRYLVRGAVPVVAQGDWPANGRIIVVDANLLVTRYTDVIIHPVTEPDTPVRLRIHLAGRMRYGYIEARYGRPIPQD